METLISGTVAGLVYLNSINSEFVYDDNRAILQNRDILPQTPIWDLLKHDFWGTSMWHTGSHRSFRPVTVFTFRLNYLISGLNPLSYHVTNVLCHVLATCLFVRLLITVLFANNQQKQSQKVLFAGLLFAVHPVHTEAVSGVVGRADVLATVFTLAALLSYKTYCDGSDLNKQTSLKNSIDKIELKEKFLKDNMKRTIKSVKQKNIKSTNLERESLTIKNGYNKKKMCHRDSKLFKTIKPISEVTLPRQTQFYNNLLEAISLRNSKRINLQIYATFLFSLLAVLSKEQGICALPLCFIYDVFLRHKFGITSSVNMMLKKNFSNHENKTIRRCWMLIGGTIFLLSLRILPFIVLQTRISPVFSSSDNPAASSNDVTTRIMTFNYLVAFNVWLLVFPLTLCYDWSSDAIPLVENIFDQRNIFTIATYAWIISIIWYVAKILGNRDESSNQETRFEYFNVVKEIKRKTETKLKNYQRIFFKNLFKLKLKIKKNWSSFKTDKNNNPYLCKYNFKELIDETVDNIEEVSRENILIGKYHNNPKEVSVDDLMTSDILVNDVSDGVSQSSGYGSEASLENHEEVSPIISKKRRVKNSSYPRIKNGIKRKSSRDLKRRKFNKVSVLTQENGDVIIMSSAIMFLSFLPASNLFFYVGFVVAERILYLPSIGFCVLLTEFSFYLHKQLNLRQNAAKLLCTTLLLLFAFRTVERNRDWRSEATLFRSALPMNSAKIWGNYAYAMKQSGNDKEAEMAYHKALQRKSNMADVHYNLGLLYQEKQLYSQALFQYDEAIRHRPSLAVAYLNKGTLLTTSGKEKEAENIYTKCASISDHGLRDPTAHARAKGSCLYNLGKLKFDQGRHLKAVEVLQHALSFRKNEPNHSVLNLIGQSLFSLGDNENAEKYFKLSLSAKSDHVPALLAYAKLLDHVGKWREAEEKFKFAISVDPKFRLVYSLYVNHLISRDKAEEAVHVAKESIRVFGPADHDSLLLAANTHRRTNRLQEAVVYYRRIVNILPNHAPSHLNLGGVFHLLGRYEEARKHYHIAMEIDPRDTTVKDNLRKLENIMDKNNL